MSFKSIVVKIGEFVRGPRRWVVAVAVGVTMLVGVGVVAIANFTATAHPSAARSGSGSADAQADSFALPGASASASAGPSNGLADRRKGRRGWLRREAARRRRRARLLREVLPRPADFSELLPDRRLVRKRHREGGRRQGQGCRPQHVRGDDRQQRAEPRARRGHVRDPEWVERGGSETTGWMITDEADMWGGPGSQPWTGKYPGQGDICSPASGKCGYTIMQKLRDELPKDSRFRYANYGKGVTFWQSDARRRVRQPVQESSRSTTTASRTEHLSPTEGGSYFNASQRLSTTRATEPRTTVIPSTGSVPSSRRGE